MNLKSINKTDVNTVELVLVLDPETFENAVEAAYRKQRSKIAIPGFRRGKITRKLAEMHFGEGCFYDDALNALLPELVDTAVTENNLDLVDRPSVDVRSINKTDGVEIAIICITKPEVEIDNYKGLTAVKKTATVTDETVEEEISKIRQKNARIISVDDRPAKIGDEVLIDFKGYFGDEAFDGGEADDFSLVLGSGAFIPGFEDQIAGKNVGDEFDVVVTFPEDYSHADYAGKEATFKCKLNAINVEELPEVTDELIADSTEFSTVEEYKADVKAKLETAAQQRAEVTFENAIIEQLAEKVECPIPPCMIEKRIDLYVENFNRQLAQQGMSVKDYMKYTGLGLAEFRESFKERAEREVKINLALEKIAELEGIEPSEDEINTNLAKLAEDNNLTVEDVRRLISLESYVDELKITKAVELVKSEAIAVDAPEEAA